MYDLNRNKLTISACVVGLLFLTSCSSMYEPIPHTSAINSNTVISSTGALSFNILLDRDSNTYFCMAPPPDSEFNQQQGGSVDLSVVKFGGQEKVSEEIQSEEIQLSGRTPSILMARELLYRVCEHSNNQRLSKNESTTLFKSALQAIQSVWAVEAGNTTISITEESRITETAVPLRAPSNNN